MTTTALPVGTSCSVRVPGSSANLGPGFDCLGMCLEIVDEIEVEIVESGLVVEVAGQGQTEVPNDDSHLVVRALLRGLDYAGVRAPGLHVRTLNRIPHSRGLGSSAAAAVGGLAAASGLIDKGGVAQRFTDETLVQLSAEFEGHPDNASASVLGGVVVSWTEKQGNQAVYRARRIVAHPRLTATAFVPELKSSTSLTRGLLPASVPRVDAVFNVSRAALAVVAISEDLSTLFAATADRLHQDYRAPAMRPSAALVDELRADGLAAVISGAGPTVLVLSDGALPDKAIRLGASTGFAVHRLALADGVNIG